MLAHGDRGPAIIAVDVSLAALASIVVLTRLYTRAFVTKFIGQDDWWILVAWVLDRPSMICPRESTDNMHSCSLCSSLGFGLHVRDLPESAFGNLEKAYAKADVKYANGRHVWNVPEKNLVPAFKASTSLS